MKEKDEEKKEERRGEEEKRKEIGFKRENMILESLN